MCSLLLTTALKCGLTLNTNAWKCKIIFLYYYLIVPGLKSPIIFWGVKTVYCVNCLHLQYSYIVHISFFSKNARGSRENVKLYFCLLDSRSQIFGVFFESHSVTVVNGTFFWKTQWGNDLWFSGGSERSPGVALFKNNFNGVQWCTLRKWS